MKANFLNENFIEVISSKFPKKSELANALMDILNIEKEAVYRRLRSEVLFSFYEVTLVAQKLGISLQDFAGVASTKSRPYHLKLTNWVEPEEIDYYMINEYLDLLREIKDDPTAELGAAIKMFPDAFHLRYKNITTYYLFKWIYQYSSPESKKYFSEIKATERSLSLLKEMRHLYNLIKTRDYILDKKIFQNLVDDLSYFGSIRLITPDELASIKEELFYLVDYLESLAVSGVNEEGNNVKLYISDVNFETDFSYLSSTNYKLSLIRTFTLYDIASLDDFTFDISKRWLNSLKRTSTLISESGQLQRIDFFNKQRQIVDSL